MSDSSQQAHAILKEIMLEVTGFDMDDLDSSASFMELGLDSLTLIQFSQSIKTRLKVKLSFRNMVEQASNIDALTEFIVQNASADVLAAAAPQEAAPQPAAEPEPEAAPQEAAPAPKAESVLPPVQMPQMPMPAMTLPPIQATAASGPPAEGLESIIQLQLQLMSMQVAMLQGTPVSQVMPATEVSPEATAAPDIPAPQSSEPLKTEAPSAPKTEAPTATVEKASPKELADAAEKTKRKRFGPYKPIRRNQDGSLTEVQKRHLDTLVEKITSLSPTSKQLTQEYRENFADPRSISGFRLAWKEMVYQIAIERSRGSKLWDMDGNEYIDIAMGFGLNLLGQSPDYVTKALEEQLQRGVETGPLSPIAGKTARMFSELTGHERVTFCNTGSEAVMAAIRLARTVSGRSKIALFTDAYHGNFDEVLVRANIIGGKRVLAPVAPGIPKSIGENLLVLEYTDPEALNEIRENADDLAAILVEPVQSAHPDVQPHEFLHQLRDLATEMDIALIVDEVISGFRAHQGGAQAYFGIKGDMATYGKIVGGGMPIGVLAGRHEYMDALDSGMWNFGDDSVPEADMTFFAGTFVRHPLAVAAAHAVLTHLKEEGPGLQEGLNQKTTELAADLNAFFQRRGVPIRITYFSSLFRFSFPPDLEFIDLLYYHLLGKGIYTRGFTENCFLSVAHSDEDIAHIIGAIKESIIELQNAGFLPDPPEDGAGVKVGKRFPLTEAQAEIFTSVQMSPEASCAFNEPFRMRLRGPFRLDHMRRAILDVMLRHESLHLRFAEDASYQEVSEPRPPIVPLVNLSHLDKTGQTEALEEAYARLASEPFDIANGPLVRVQIFRLSDEDHIITFSAHHLVSDGWSTDVMLGEIGEIYSTLCQNQSFELPPTMPFSDYAAEEVEMADTTEVAETYAFWGEQFAQLPPALDLPTDRPRPARKSYKGATVTWKFDDQTYLAIKQRAADEGASLFAVLLSSFQLLMARLANQTDLAVAVATAGQMEIGADTTTGQCVNLLPVRAQMDMNASFRDYLEEAKGNLLDVLDHKEITFGSIIRHLQVPRDPSRLPLVEVNFNLDRDGRGMELYQLETEIAQTPKKAVNFDIFFNLNEQNDHLLVDCDYNADLFDEETIQRWMTYFEHLMEDIAANPEKPMAELNMMPATEVDKLLKEWNSTEMEYPRDATVQELIDAQAARTPDAMAVICGHRKLTYGELEQQSNQLAHHLRDMGIGTGNLVGVCLERCIEMPVALLGILKSGAAYVPLDPDYPTQRLDYMAKDAGLQALITQHNLIDRLPSLDATMICIDTDREAIASNSTDLSERHSGPEDTAYIIYTSGSTGNPKGVQIPHRALTNFLCSMQREPGMTAEDTLLSVTTLSFDISGLELYLPLITGANVAIASMEEITDGRQLAQALETYQATQMQATPATWRMLIEADWAGRPDMKVLCGGEALTVELARQLQQRAGQVWNVYGPTETTIWSSVVHLEDELDMVTIGRPIANTQLYILDKKLQPVPRGAVGVLYIGGDGLAQGYLNQPELTAEKFVVNPFSDYPARIYNTGDLARYLPDGQVECLGRVDSQVKIRGFRIELGEIEAMIDQHQEVVQNAVVVREDGGEKNLVAYIVPEQAEQLTADNLRSFLMKRLPYYMIPTIFATIEVLPMTPNGKVDRKALPAPDQNRLGQEQGFVAPSTPAETSIAGIWKELLDVEQIGVHDDFFALGGHSILAIRTITRMRDILETDLALGALFEHPTVASIAEFIEAMNLLESTEPSEALLDVEMEETEI